MPAIPFSDPCKTEIYGAKAAALGKAFRAGLPVPRGIGIDVQLLKDILDGKREAIEELKKAYHALSTPIAVRSSAIGEDSSEASFAGQHRTVLNVRSEEQVLKALKEVSASAYQESALKYREKMGMTRSIQIAALLQEMVQPDCAGVLFTKNPLTGEDEIIIEASWGLGEAVVAGLVIPDRYRLSRQGELRERTAGEKDLALVADEEGKVLEQEIHGEKITALCLSDHQLHELHQLAQDCEKIFGTALDIEWAYEKDMLYLLQCRGITSTK